jgi:endogenous inhibitor of DNA gyrase (YacG/DUF329 family)
VAEVVPPGKCPTCRMPVPPDAKHFPFCTDRCRLVDLGRWFKGDYVVGRPLRPDEEPPEPPPADD